MKVDLDREDLINLVSGVSPSYELMDNPKIRELGNFMGSYGRWEWNSEIEDLSEKELFEIYKLCK